MRSPTPSRGRREVSPWGGGMRSFMNQFEKMFNDMEQDFFSNVPSVADRGLQNLAEFTPSVDIEESDEMYLVSADLPGLKKEDIKIDISSNMLRISGQKSSEVKEGGYYERTSGKFSRSFTLPEGVDPKKIEANFEDGVLRIALPKTEVKPAQEIKIQAGSSQGGLLDRFLHKEKTVKGGEEKAPH